MWLETVCTILAILAFLHAGKNWGRSELGSSPWERGSSFLIFLVAAAFGALFLAGAKVGYLKSQVEKGLVVLVEKSK